MNWFKVRDLRVEQGGFRLRVPELDLAGGEMVAVLGPNGSGKSTLLRALADLISYQGEIFLAGRPLSQVPEKERFRLVSYLPQSAHLGLPFEVYYVVLTGRYPLLAGRGYSASDFQAVERLLDLLDLVQLRLRLFGELSGGERQRVLLARALAREAPVLLLDEPLAALDLHHQHRIMRYLGDYVRQRNGLVLAVLHDLALALKYFRRFLLLRRGYLYGDVGVEELSPDLLSRVMGVRIEFVPWENERLVRVKG